MEDKDKLLIILKNGNEIKINSENIYFDKRFVDNHFKIVISLKLNKDEREEKIEDILKLNYNDIEMIKINDNNTIDKIASEYKVLSFYYSNNNLILNKLDKENKYLNLIIEYSNNKEV